ncbi:capsule biosynthesis protein [Palleronia sp. KMU-117]|uniref:capsule biosynthesis protein n=1 Tax=Palleronia sp. KMU-117 TaxID=3434108 RepID=UPI003D70B594
MAKTRRFLMLQGPHGPFFTRLAAMLTAAGAEVWRVGFNGGDSLFWRDRARYLPYRGGLTDWPDWLAACLDARGITDIVLYGEPRPLHATALEVARARGLRTHLFEEGYLRPYWVTYERDGTNGHSPLMALDLDDMLASLVAEAIDMPEAPALWGDMREHVLYGAIYHAAVALGGRRYPGFLSHRGATVGQEFGLYLRRLALMPVHHLQRAVSSRRLRNGGYPYHLVLLQLEHDSSFRAFSPFRSMTDFLDVVLHGFARGAPGHHHLVFKAHPLEDGRAALAAAIARRAAALGVADRVHFLIGGKLAPMLDSARSVVTVNSTAAQQALWRGLPVKAFGTAVYGKPGFVSDHPLPAFFADPVPSDLAAYRGYRRFLLKTSQIRGGFYSARGRREVLRRIVDLMLAEASPYEAALGAGAAQGQHLRALP